MMLAIIWKEHLYTSELYPDTVPVDNLDNSCTGVCNEYWHTCMIQMGQYHCNTYLTCFGVKHYFEIIPIN